MLRILEESLTFDDVLLVPGYSEITAKDVSLKTQPRIKNKFQNWFVPIILLQFESSIPIPNTDK